MSRDPGVYEMTHADYHAQTDSLSSTGARKLLPPSCPALFRWWLDHPEEPKTAFDLGNAVHDTLLGGGPEIVVIPDDLLGTNGAINTKEAKAFVADVRERGAVPITSEQDAEVRAMVASVRAHPFAGPLFEDGQPEASLFWKDERTGVDCRARLDFLPQQRGRRLIVPDLKSARSAQRDEFAKSAANYGYNQQADFYLNGVRALELAEDPVLVFVAVEKTAPYLVNVIQLDVSFKQIGAARNRRAIDTYAECIRTGEWPGYSAEVELASPPVWYERANEELVA